MICYVDRYKSIKYKYKKYSSHVKSNPKFCIIKLLNHKNINFFDITDKYDIDLIVRRIIRYYAVNKLHNNIESGIETDILYNSYYRLVVRAIQSNIVKYKNILKEYSTKFSIYECTRSSCNVKLKNQFSRCNICNSQVCSKCLCVYKNYDKNSHDKSQCIKTDMYMCVKCTCINDKGDDTCMLCDWPKDIHLYQTDKVIGLINSYYDNLNYDPIAKRKKIIDVCNHLYYKYTIDKNFNKLDDLVVYVKKHFNDFM